MADPSDDPEVTIEQRLETLETEYARTQQANQVQGLVINQYRQALADANHQNAILTAQLKLANQPTA
jgi:hypothetical protein